MCVVYVLLRLVLIVYGRYRYGRSVLLCLAAMAMLGGLRVSLSAMLGGPSLCMAAAMWTVCCYVGGIFLACRVAMIGYDWN